MREALEKTIKSLWQGAETTPDIIVSLESQGIRVTEKRVLDTAIDLGMENSKVHSRLYDNPTLMDKWWAQFRVREEKSALELLNAKNIKGKTGVGKARHIVGCCVADELLEGGAKPTEAVGVLKKKGFKKEEIDRIQKEVGF